MNKSIKVVRIYSGNEPECEQVALQSPPQYEFYPLQVPQLLGFPLGVKIEKRGKHTNNYVSYLMIDRKSGFAPLEWISGGKDANDMIVGRTDGQDFLVEDYIKLHDYIMHLLDFYPEEIPSSKDFSP